MVSLPAGGSRDLGLWEADHHKVEQRHPGIQRASEIKDWKTAGTWHLEELHAEPLLYLITDLTCELLKGWAGNVQARTKTVSCTCCTVFPSVWQCCTVLNMTQTPSAVLWLADSPEASRCILECIPLCCLHRKVLFFHVLFIPTCMQQLLGHILYLKNWLLSPPHVKLQFCLI